MSELPGFTRPGGPIEKEPLREAWMRVYLSLMITTSPIPEKKEKLNKLHDLLAESNEIVMELLE